MAEFDTGFARIAGRFRRVEPRRQVRAYLLGLLSDVDTRTCWQLAEQAGDPTPHRMQRLLGEAVWDADKVRDDVRGYVVDELGDTGAVLILDDTGDLKKGTHSVGVQRQYTGTAGRIENAQVSVFLVYATPRGYTLIDREIYLPRCWADDPARRSAAGVPDEVRFATKIAVARRMLTRALDAGIPAAWATADEFYGGDRHLRRDLQARGVGYVLAVAKSHRVTARAVDGPVRADQLARDLPARAWNRVSAGDGAKGHRDYDWAWITITPPADEAAGQHTLLIRRRISDGELAFYRCWSPRPVPLRVLVAVAGTRWRIETAFHQVRRWDSWYRHTTLVMLAHAILTVIAAREQARPRRGQHGPVRPRQAGLPDLPPKHGDLMAQHQQLGDHRGFAARRLRQPAKHPNRAQVQQPNKHAPDPALQQQNTSSHPMRQFCTVHADGVRDDVRRYAVDALGDPDGVLILDDTGDLKKGDLTVGTQRQYTGTAGRSRTRRWPST